MYFFVPCLLRDSENEEYVAIVSAQGRWESWNESETFGQYRFRRKRLLRKLSKDNNVSINVIY